MEEHHCLAGLDTGGVQAAGKQREDKKKPEYSILGCTFAEAIDIMQKQILKGCCACSYLLEEKILASRLCFSVLALHCISLTLISSAGAAGYGSLSGRETFGSSKAGAPDELGPNACLMRSHSARCSSVMDEGSAGAGRGR